MTEKKKKEREEDITFFHSRFVRSARRETSLFKGV